MGIMAKEHHIINLCYAPIIAPWHCECRFLQCPLVELRIHIAFGQCPMQLDMFIEPLCGKGQCRMVTTGVHRI
jgi:hypothetical protein